MMYKEGRKEDERLVPLGDHSSSFISVTPSQLFVGLSLLMSCTYVCLVIFSCLYFSLLHPCPSFPFHPSYASCVCEILVCVSCDVSLMAVCVCQPRFMFALASH